MIVEAKIPGKKKQNNFCFRDNYADFRLSAVERVTGVMHGGDQNSFKTEQKINLRF